MLPAAETALSEDRLGKAAHDGSHRCATAAFVPAPAMPRVQMPSVQPNSPPELAPEADGSGRPCSPAATPDRIYRWCVLVNSLAVWIMRSQRRQISARSSEQNITAGCSCTSERGSTFRSFVRETPVSSPSSPIRPPVHNPERRQGFPSCGASRAASAVGGVQHARVARAQPSQNRLIQDQGGQCCTWQMSHCVGSFDGASATRSCFCPACFAACSLRDAMQTSANVRGLNCSRVQRAAPKRVFRPKLVVARFRTAATESLCRAEAPQIVWQRYHHKRSFR